MSKSNTKALEASRNLGKTMSVAYLSMFAVGLVLMVKAIGSNGDIYTIDFVQQNMGRALSLGAFGVVLLLATMQKNVYWDFGRRKTELDEREIALRRRLFERSYKLSILAVAVGMYLLLGNLDWLKHNLQNPLGSDLQWILLDVFAFLLALPPLIAAWQKDTSVFPLFQKSTSKKQYSLASWVVKTCAMLWLAFLVALILPGVFGGYSSLFLQIFTLTVAFATLLTLPAVVILFVRFLKNPK